MLRKRKTKIVATVGPSSQSFEKLDELYRSGVDVFRLNFSHGDQGTHEQVISSLRKLEEKYNRPICILADLQGPKLRIGTFEKGKITLSPGGIFQFDLRADPGSQNRVSLPHPEIFQAIYTRKLAYDAGLDILVNDGKMRLRVQHATEDTLVTKVLVGGEISDRKGVNVPGVALPLSSLTPKDLSDLEYILRYQVDWVALSFVQRAADVQELRENLLRSEGHKPKIVVKIEKPQALEELTEIIHLADAVMVARGDLGVEMSPEEVPGIQKDIIYACREAGKPVIVATQMLESMIHSPSPTRAEASDVATAVYDGVDAVTLSAESANGLYPLEAVEIMSRIIEKVEQDPFYHRAQSLFPLSTHSTTSDAMTAAARQVTQAISVKAVVTFTETGRSVLREARERPAAQIVALTPTLFTARMMGLFWGTYGAVIVPIDSFSEMVKRACDVVSSQRIASSGDTLLILAGIPFGQQSGFNVMRLIELS